jgi:hypothetical protein
MGETNGQGESRLDRMQDQLERVQASHVKLMTDHEVFVREHEKRVEKQDRELQELWKKNELAHQRFLDADAVLAQRITDLWSGIGAFMRGGKAE